FSLAQYNVAACPPVLSFTSERRRDCADLNELVVRKLAAQTPDTVIMAARWEAYDGHDGWGALRPDMIRASINRLVTLGVKRIVVIGQFPVWEIDVPRIRVARVRAASTAPPAAGDGDRAQPAQFEAEVVVDAMVQHALDGTSAIFVSPLK